MRIDNLEKAKKQIGNRLYWDDIGSRYIFIRSGILTHTFRRQIAFDDTHDYRPIAAYKNLRTTKEGGAE